MSEAENKGASLVCLSDDGDVSFVVDSTVLTISLSFEFSPNLPDLFKSSQM